MQLHEDAGGIGGTGLAHHRIADLNLVPVATLDPAPGWVTAAGHGAVVRADGRGVAVIDGSGMLVRTVAHAWAGGVHEGAAARSRGRPADPVVAELPPGRIASTATIAAALLAGLVLAAGIARRR